MSPFCTDRMLATVPPHPGGEVLDVATGTGAVAIVAAQIISPQGRVSAIDLSERTLLRADANIIRVAFANADFRLIDAQALEFQSNYFDYVRCSFGLLFVSDAVAVLRDWLPALKSGGRLMLSSFGAARRLCVKPCCNGPARSGCRCTKRSWAIRRRRGMVVRGPE